MPNTSFLGDNPTRAQLLRAAARNHQQMWAYGARLRGGEVCRGHGVTWIYTPGSAGGVAIAFPRLTRATAGEALDTIVDDCRRRRPLRSVACWSLGPARELGARLLARGFEWGWQPHWMALDLRALTAEHPTPEGLRIEPLEAAAISEGEAPPYYDREDAVHWPAEARARPRHVWRFAARLDGQFVGQSCLFVTTGRLGVAGIYGCGVLPAARRQGIGTAVTRAACEFAERLGCRHALLNATPLGERAYLRLGFTSLGDGQTWWLHRPILETPPPPPAQVRFIEAIGRGDGAALEEIRGSLTPEALEAVLPCGMTPLAVAVTLRRPASAEWLVRQGAVLDVISAWDLGWKERVPRLLAEAPELANRQSGDWQVTPLHVAAERGDVELARVLLEAGADPTLQDSRFQSTPLGWARHFDRTEIVALIEQSSHGAGTPGGEKAWRI